MTIGWHFDNSYSKLSKTFKEDIKPTPVHEPELVILNDELAKNLNLNFSGIDKKKLAEIFSGNSLPDGTNSIAQAYAGHQFGHFIIEQTYLLQDKQRVMQHCNNILFS